MLPILIYTSFISLKRRMWKMSGFTKIPAYPGWLSYVIHSKERDAHTINEMGAYSEETILLEEMPTDSEPGLDNVGTGPMLETGREQRWSACMARREEVVTHWWQCGSQDGPQCCSTSAGGGLCCCLGNGTVPSTPWRTVVSCCHKRQGGNSCSAGLENFLSNPVPPLQCFGNAEVDDSWKSKDRNYLIEEILGGFSVWSASELPVTQQSLHLSGWSYDLSNSGQFRLTYF